MLKHLLTVNFLIDLTASRTTLAGIFLGSTTQAGAAAYLVSNAFWWVLMWRRRMWGIAPLNAGCLVLTIINLARATS